MNYIYSAVFTEDSGKVIARVPDLPGCVSSGKTLEEAIIEITDAASGYLVVAEDEELEIHAPTPQHLIPRGQDEALSYIRIDTVSYRARTDTRAVRKNVSLPAWMVALADKRGLNCSKILQEGLMKRFGG